MCGALKLSGIVCANVRLNIAIAMLFVPNETRVFGRRVHNGDTEEVAI